MSAAVCKCGQPAVWEFAPSDSFGEWCDACVPRGCSCNASYDPETQDWNGPEETDEQGRLLPCCEIWFCPEGFEAGDPEKVAKYRAATSARKQAAQPASSQVGMTSKARNALSPHPPVGKDG